MTHPANTLSLVSDIGGTNTRCALAQGTKVLPETIRRYSNAEYSGLETVIRQYLADEGDVDPIAACVAVAGPVRDGRGTMTNLDWQIDDATLMAATKAEHVSIVNDLQAQGYAIDSLPVTSVRSILPGPAQTPDAKATCLVVGVGTGFNAAPVFSVPGGRLVTASESGHADLPVKTDLETRLGQFIAQTHGIAAVENVLSGRGLECVYAFLGEEAGDPQTKSAKDIMDGCNAKSDERAIAAVSMVVKMLGTVCGNLALIQLPFGGIYLVGGVARALSAHFAEFGFAESFADKGRFSDFMSNFSVSIVEDDYAALSGAASHISSVIKTAG